MRFLQLLLAGTLLAAVGGCGKVLNENDPVSVARAFWSAALGPNPAEAKPFMVRGNTEVIAIRGHNDADTAVLGEVDQQEGYYFIETTLQLHRDGVLLSVPLRTVIVPVDGQWRVDYWSTKQSVLGSAVDASVRWLLSTLDNAGAHIDDIWGTENQEQPLEYIGRQLDDTFAHAKTTILERYKARPQPLSSGNQSVTLPAEPVQ